MGGQFRLIGLTSSALSSDGAIPDRAAPAAGPGQTTRKHPEGWLTAGRFVLKPILARLCGQIYLALI